MPPLPKVSDRPRFVANVAALSSITGKRDGDQAQTLGYTTAGDGGGNVYYWDDGSSATADGGFVITATGGRWVAADQTVVNAKQFGCTGDGVTDDTARLAAAFGAASDGDLDVVVAGGTYLLSTWAAQTISGKVRVSAAPDAVFAVQAGEDFLTLAEGGELEWTGGAITTGANGFLLANAATAHERLVVRDVSFSVTDTAIGDSGSANQPKLNHVEVTGCTFTGGEFGVRLRAVNMVHCVIDNLTVRSLSGSGQLAGVSLGDNSSTTSGMVRVGRVDVDGVASTGDGVDTHGVIVYYPRSSITDCRIANVSNNNATNDEGLYTKSVYGLVSGNVLVDAGKGEGSLSCKGLGSTEGSATPSGYRMRVVKNVVTSSSTDHPLIYMRTDGCLCEGNMLSGGSIAINSISPGCLIANNLIWGTGTGTGIDSDSDATISSNRVFDRANGIRFTPASSEGDWVCVGNHVDDCTIGIFPNGASSGTQAVSITGNVVRDCTYGIRSTSNQSSLEVTDSGNIFRNCTTNRDGQASFGSYRRDGQLWTPEVFTASSGGLTKEGVTYLDSSSNAINATLGAGDYPGQIKTIVMTNADNSSTVTAANHETSDPEVWTFDAVDECLVLMWMGTEWATLKATATT